LYLFIYNKLKIILAECKFRGRVSAKDLSASFRRGFGIVLSKRFLIHRARNICEFITKTCCDDGEKKIGMFISNIWNYNEINRIKSILKKE